MIMIGTIKNRAVLPIEISLVFLLYLSAKMKINTGEVCVPIYAHCDQVIFCGRETAADSIPMQNVHSVNATKRKKSSEPPRSDRLFHRTITTTNETIDVIN